MKNYILTSIILLIILCPAVWANGPVDDDTHIGFVCDPPANAEVVDHYIWKWWTLDGTNRSGSVVTDSTKVVIDITPIVADVKYIYVTCTGVNLQGQEGYESPVSDTVTVDITVLAPGRPRWVEDNE